LFYGPRVDVVPLLASLEPLGGETDLRPALALLAARDFEPEPGALNACVRRAMFVLAAGGDPHRDLDVDGRAVATLAADVDDEGLRRALADGVTELEPQAASLPYVAAALAELRGDAALAVRAWACALLAEVLD
jgi:hypothetical protein